MYVNVYRRSQSSSSISDLSDEVGERSRRTIFSRNDASCEFAGARGTTSVPTISCQVFRSRPRASSGSEIRCRLLNRLGFSKKRPTCSENSCSDSSVERFPVIRKDTTNAFQDVLKDDNGKCDKLLDARSRSSCSQPLSTASPGDSSASSTGRKERNRSVSFDASVKVHLIPSHADYSKRIRPTLWTSGPEAQQSVARNCFEYASEGWEPTHCEEYMVDYFGEPVHPVHFAAKRNLHWHFCAVRAMQQEQQG